MESSGTFFGRQVIILYVPPFLSVSTAVNSTVLFRSLFKSFVSILIISSFSFSRIRDSPPQIFRAFSDVKEKRESWLVVIKSSSLLYEAKRDTIYPNNKNFYLNWEI